MNSKKTLSCPCCASSQINEEWGLISPFLAKRALKEAVTLNRLYRCQQCEFSWSERRLSSEELMRLYDLYRGEQYFKERNEQEPWYTKRINEQLGSMKTMEGRQKVMHDFLKKIPVDRKKGSILDVGGDQGQMLEKFEGEDKWIFDISGVTPKPWAKKVDIADLNQHKNRHSLVLSCQVLEHVDEPLDMVKNLVHWTEKGGWVYLEVPYEIWEQQESPWRKDWLNKVIQKPVWLKGLDFVSTVCRIRWRKIPSFGFWALREHFNFFSEKSLKHLAEKAGLEVLKIENNGSILMLVGRKK